MRDALVIYWISRLQEEDSVCKNVKGRGLHPQQHHQRRHRQLKYEDQHQDSYRYKIRSTECHYRSYKRLFNAKKSEWRRTKEDTTCQLQ
eukprot:1365763-Amphidinium_carterae.1